MGYLRDRGKGDIFEEDGIPSGSTDILQTDDGNLDVAYKDGLKTRSALSDHGHVKVVYGKPGANSFTLLEDYAPDAIAILRKFTFAPHERNGTMLTMVTRDDPILDAPTGKMLISQCTRALPST